MAGNRGMYVRGMITDTSTKAVELANQMAMAISSNRLHDYRMEM